MKVVATIEARMTSYRLPGKVLMPVSGKPMLQILIERLQNVKRIDEIVVATTVNATDQPIADLAHKLGVGCFRGSEEDVLDRVSGALKKSQADVCVEITGDCPLIDPTIVAEAINEYFKTAADHPYVSNSDPQRAVPAGLDVQVFSAAALYKLNAETQDTMDREHVSYGFYRPESGNRWKPRYLKHKSCAGAEHFWVSLDYQEDYDLIKQAHEELSKKNPHYLAGELIEWMREHPDLHEACLKLRGRSLHASSL